MEEDKITEKTINKYVIQFKTRFNKTNSDYILLDMDISKELQDVLKECVVLDELTDYSFDNGDEHITLKRYKIKKWIYSLFYERDKELLFLKKLIDSGKETLKISSVGRIDVIISNLKNNLRELIQNIVKYNKLNMVVTFNTN